jgi:hypothetical protein
MFERHELLFDKIELGKTDLMTILELDRQWVLLIKTKEMVCELIQDPKMKEFVNKQVCTIYELRAIAIPLVIEMKRTGVPHKTWREALQQLFAPTELVPVIKSSNESKKTDVAKTVEQFVLSLDGSIYL